MSVKLVSEIWREEKIEEQRMLRAGEIDSSECCMDELYSDAFVAKVELLLKSFVDQVNQLSVADVAFLGKHLKSLVIALNDVNEEYDHAVIETGEREQLCQFMEDVINDSKVDLEEFATHLGCEQDEVTDQWRDW